MLSTSKIRAFLTLIVSISLMFWLYPKVSEPNKLEELVRGLGTPGFLLDLVILALQMLFPLIPFPLLAGINAIVFGWPLGFLISLSGSMLGSSLGFWLARTLAPEKFRARLAHKLSLRMTLLNEGFTSVFLARLIPIIPAAAVNYLAGLSSIRFSTFFGASLLGKIPIMAWETALGQNVWQISSHPWRFVLTAFTGLAVLPVYFLYLKKRSGKKNQA